jgi:transposase
MPNQLAYELQQTTCYCRRVGVQVEESVEENAISFTHEHFEANVSSDIKYCQHIHRTALPSLASSRDPDSTVFEDFIEQLLPLCGKWPEPKSVLVMDNASFHHTKRIEQICHDAGVKLVYLPPYSPDFNPIEEFFAELKAFIKRNWHIYEENPSIHRMVSADIRTIVVNLKLFLTMKLFPTIKLIRVNLNITTIILPLL